MDFTIGETSAGDVAAIEAWHYEPPYDFYDFTADPEDLGALRARDGDERFFAVRSDEVLAGFFSVILDGEAVIIGLGLRPDLTGRGHGEGLIRAGLEFAARRYRPAMFRLMVASFNERARRVYERLGFVETGRIIRHVFRGDFEFVLMQMPADSLNPLSR